MTSGIKTDFKDSQPVTVCDLLDCSLCCKKRNNKENLKNYHCKHRVKYVGSFCLRGASSHMMWGCCVCVCLCVPTLVPVCEHPVTPHSKQTGLGGTDASIYDHHDPEIWLFFFCFLEPWAADHEKVGPLQHRPSAVLLLLQWRQGQCCCFEFICFNNFAPVGT